MLLHIRHINSRSISRRHRRIEGSNRCEAEVTIVNTVNKAMLLKMGKVIKDVIIKPIGYHSARDLN